MTASPDRDPQKKPTEVRAADSETPLHNLEDKQLNLQLEVERLYRQVEELRVWLQTLVTGLVIATAIAIGISSWFAYRLLSQEQMARREASEAATVQGEIFDRLQELEEEVDGFDRQLSAELEDWEENSNLYQQRWQELRDRLTRLEAAAGKETDGDAGNRGSAEER